jgi:hypothetical protein
VPDRGCLPKALPRPWAAAMPGIMSRARRTAAATRSVMFIDPQARPPVAAASLPTPRRSVFVALNSELAHRLTEAQGIVAGHLRFQIRERDVMVLRLLQGGNELSLIAEAFGRIFE